MLRRIRKFIKNDKGQPTAEYAIVLSLVIAAAIGMQVWVKRGLQAKQKDAMDFVSTFINASDATYGSYLTITNQFEPLSTDSSFMVGRDVTNVEALGTGGSFRYGVDERTGRTGYQKYTAPTP